MRKTELERFWEKVEKTETCWLWKGTLNSTGYGNFRAHGKKHMLAHRFSYIIINGAIPEGLEIDHLCRVRNCVNPAHLEAVTPTVNVQRAVPFTKDPKDFEKRDTRTKCLYGHEFTPETTMLIMGGRACKLCYDQ